MPIAVTLLLLPLNRWETDPIKLVEMTMRDEGPQRDEGLHPTETSDPLTMIFA